MVNLENNSFMNHFKLLFYLLMTLLVSFFIFVIIIFVDIIFDFETFKHLFKFIEENLLLNDLQNYYYYLYNFDINYCL